LGLKIAELAALAISARRKNSTKIEQGSMETTPKARMVEPLQH